MENNKKDAWALYAKIGKVWCPALNDFIVFNRMGFQHLLRKRGRKRRENEQGRRFGLLLSAKDIIEDSNTQVFYSPKVSIRHIEHHDKKTTKKSITDFWVLSKTRSDGSTIKVIIRKFEHGKKHFFSVY